MIRHNGNLKKSMFLTIICSLSWLHRYCPTIFVWFCSIRTSSWAHGALWGTGAGCTALLQHLASEGCSLASPPRAEVPGPTVKFLFKLLKIKTVPSNELQGIRNGVQKHIWKEIGVSVHQIALTSTPYQSFYVVHLPGEDVKWNSFQHLRKYHEVTQEQINSKLFFYCFIYLQNIFQLNTQNPSRCYWQVI